MYDVVYINADGDETPVAQHLDDRKGAAEVARQAAAERGAGRMVLPGSNRPPNCVCVIPPPADVVWRPPGPAEQSRKGETPRRGGGGAARLLRHASGSHRWRLDGFGDR